MTAMLRRLLSPFVLVLTAILALVYAYLATRLASGATSLAALAAPFVLVWLVPVVYWVGERDRDSFADEALHFASYLSMGWLNFAFFLSVGRDLALIVCAATGLDRTHLYLAAYGPELVLGGSIVMLAAGAAAALRGPRVRRVDIPIEGLDARLDGVRIVQISDLHVGQSIGRRYVARVARMANELAPDLVALTGDFVDGAVSRLAGEIAPLAGLQAPGGVFFITGNHEYYSGADEWIAHLGTLGIRVLRNERVAIRDAFDLAGVDDTSARRMAEGHGQDVARALQGRDPSRAVVLLAHQPKAVRDARRADVDLQISGHVHGGQLVPFNWLVLLDQPFVSGLHQVDRTWVYVSAGTGYWGPPMRVGSRAEVTRIELVAAG
jgi:predicted MPP superfamily phosphohydrolase